MTASREQERQQQLLRALWCRDTGVLASGDLRPLRHDVAADRGLRSYQANAGAAIERALASTFPTVLALVGEESFAALARAYWHEHPPTRGDLALAGESLPSFIESSPQLADVPYLADVARLDAAMEAAERAADAAWQPETLALLGSEDPTRLVVELMPGTTIVASPYPIVTLREAHWHAAAREDPFAAARQALARGLGEKALVWRSGFRARAMAVDEATAAWTISLSQSASLAAALDQSHAEFDFERWLITAIEQRWVAYFRADQTSS